MYVALDNMHAGWKYCMVRNHLIHTQYLSSHWLFTQCEYISCYTQHRLSLNLAHNALNRVDSLHPLHEMDWISPTPIQALSLVIMLVSCSKSKLLDTYVLVWVYSAVTAARAWVRMCLMEGSRLSVTQTHCRLAQSAYYGVMSSRAQTKCLRDGQCNFDTTAMQIWWNDIIQ